MNPGDGDAIVGGENAANRSPEQDDWPPVFYVFWQELVLRRIGLLIHALVVRP